jgi:protein-S-isoprenylcysteine O-methyltransferase Ste14
LRYFLAPTALDVAEGAGVILLAFAFALGWLPLFMIRTESLSAALPFYSRSERLSVFAARIIMSVHMTVACWSVSLTAAAPWWRTVAGITIFLLGMAFWVWARVAIGPIRVRTLPTDPPARLRRDGAFGLVRNPLYFGLLVSAAGPAIVAGTALPFATLTLAVIVFALRARQEEVRLHAQLGQAYATYCRDVKRLLPFVW